MESPGTYAELRVCLPPQAEELFSLHCFAEGALGIWTLAEAPAQVQLCVAFAALSHAEAGALIAAFARAQPGFGGQLAWEWAQHPREAWETSWREHFRPTEVGERLLVLPPWALGQGGALPGAQAQRIPLIIEPGQGFGTGGHPSTRLVLRLLEQLLRGPGQAAVLAPRMLDVGTGSGVLGLAAARLGGLQAVLLDLEAPALQEAQRNFTLNGLPAPLCIQGSVECLQGRFGLVTANITAGVLHALRPRLCAALLPGGRLLLGGLLCAEEAALVGAFTQAEAEPLQLRARQEEEGWCALAFARP